MNSIFCIIDTLKEHDRHVLEDSESYIPKKTIPFPKGPPAILMVGPSMLYQPQWELG